MAVEALMRAVHGALTAAGTSGAYVGLLRSCLVTDEDGEPIGEARTLVDGYFDLRRTGEAMPGITRKDRRIEPVEEAARR